MESLHLVTHCWNYSRLLCYQLSSLVDCVPNRFSTTCTVFYCRDDVATVKSLLFFQGFVFSPTICPGMPWLNWDFRPLPPDQLCRRAIGRNMAAKDTSADWVWFLDCDYVFGLGCLDSLPDELPKVTGPLAYPRAVYRSTTHQCGDEAIERVTKPKLYAIDPDDFSAYRNRRAIGGIQIVRGDVCRRHGYLDGHPKHQRPVKRWRRTFEDTAFRRSLGTKGEPINLPNLYRIRHSKRGRTHVGVEL